MSGGWAAPAKPVIPVTLGGSAPPPRPQGSTEGTGHWRGRGAGCEQFLALGGASAARARALLVFVPPAVAAAAAEKG
eukprot:gene14539-biopygen6588